MTDLDHYDFSSGSWKKKGEKMDFTDQFPDSSVGKESACNAGDLGWEDPLEKGKATHFSILAWRIAWTV